ncbi:DUF4114 domain-containing protein [Azorhizobium caulinodans]|uniref:DUF4114 domain-containing protein n=1 Tax=Azorhizobium caulinodans TaxID=7 RepID=UPI002FBD42ED
MATTYTAVQNTTYFDYSSYQLATSAQVSALAAVPATNLSATNLGQVQSLLTQTMFGNAKAAPPADTGLPAPIPLVAVADLTTQTGLNDLGFIDQDQGSSENGYAFQLKVADIASSTITVGLVVNRNADPTALLSMPWADRQAALADQTAVWATYGGSKFYSGVQSTVESLTGVSTLTVDDGYNSSADSRTVWLNLTPAQFKTLFNTDLLVYAGANQSYGSYVNYAWSGNLSLPSNIQSQVSGIWVSTLAPTPYGSPAPNPAAPVALSQGAQSPGNSQTGANESNPTPTQVAEAYNFPLTSKGVVTTPIGLVEGGVPANLETALNAYRTSVLGLPAYTGSQFQIISGANARIGVGDPGEESLDVSIIAGAAPNSQQLYYAYTGNQTFVGYQNAIFDSVNNPSVLSSSFTDQQRFSPNSPFASAYQGLFVDGALKNMSVFLSSGDGGSGGEYGAGTAMGRPSHSSPYAVIVGGASISNLQTASGDPTLSSLYTAGMTNDPVTLMALTASGMKVLPQHMTAETYSIFVQTVWNTYSVNGESINSSYASNSASTGGINAGSLIPSYQTDFGLTPTNAQGEAGRGLPDVSALAGGNSKYSILNGGASAGTSAATPLWAALTAQIDTIFKDQGLPQLGYFNDLLYQAAAIAPGSFSDVTIGNNTSTYYLYTGTEADKPYVLTQSGTKVVPTGLGYPASAGYDQATGLGTPNGLLLARALSTIAHSQFDAHPAAPVLIGIGDTSAQSGAAQSLLVQATGALGAYELNDGGHVVQGVSEGNTLAWSSRLAQQVMQKDFDPDLVRLLDGGAQATPTTVHADAGASLSSSVAGLPLGLYQADLTSQYGFASFGGVSSGVTVARPVAVADVADDGAAHQAVVRLRQNGVDATSLMLYKVDDLSGTIDGIAPGDPGYAAAAAAHAYVVGGAAGPLPDPGYGNYTEAVVNGVHHGDLVAMALTNGTQTYWGFAPANESVGGASVTHLWSYGLNTFGFEDTFGGGDRDYNDLIVQLDFTSLQGHGWIA